MANNLLCVLLATAAILSSGYSAAQPGKRQQSPDTPTDAFSTIQAEAFTSNSGVGLYTVDSVVYVGAIENGDYVCYTEVDFQNSANGIFVQMSSSYPPGFTGTIDLVQGAPTNLPFHTVVVGTTYTDTNWFTISEFLNGPTPAGIWQLCLVFHDAHATASYLNVDWFYFF